jgi:hypothetical protein
MGAGIVFFVNNDGIVSGCSLHRKQLCISNPALCA